MNACSIQGLYEIMTLILTSYWGECKSLLSSQFSVQILLGQLDTDRDIVTFVYEHGVGQGSDLKFNLILLD